MCVNVHVHVCVCARTRACTIILPEKGVGSTGDEVLELENESSGKIIHTVSSASVLVIWGRRDFSV